MAKTKETQKKRLEVAEAKVAMLREVTKVMRTPLTLIITPLLSLMQEDDDPHRQGIYKTIQRNTERILSLIDPDWSTTNRIAIGLALFGTTE